MMKRVIKLFVLMALVGMTVYGKVPEAQKLCDAEVKKEKPNMQVVKEQCSEIAEFYENEKRYDSASLYYLLSGNNDKNIKIIKPIVMC